MEKIAANSCILKAKVVATLKYLSNYQSSLDPHLINCEIVLDLTWSIDCISAILNSAKISINPAAVLPVLDLPKGCITDAIFEMNIARLYVSVVTLSINDTTKFKKNLKSRRFKSTISWNGYRSEITTEPENNLSCMIDRAFRSFFFYLGFFSRIFRMHRTAGEGGGYLCNSFLPLPPASQTIRHYPGNYR